GRGLGERPFEGGDGVQVEAGDGAREEPSLGLGQVTGCGVRAGTGEHQRADETGGRSDRDAACAASPSWWSVYMAWSGHGPRFPSVVQRVPARTCRANRRKGDAGPPPLGRALAGEIAPGTVVTASIRRI